jgi:hypothetical protein
VRGSVRFRCDYATALDFEVDPLCVFILLQYQFGFVVFTIDPVYLLLCVFITAVPVLRFKTREKISKRGQTCWRRVAWQSQGDQSLWRRFRRMSFRASCANLTLRRWRGPASRAKPGGRRYGGGQRGACVLRVSLQVRVGCLTATMGAGGENKRGAAVCHSHEHGRDA